MQEVYGPPNLIANGSSSILGTLVTVITFLIIPIVLLIGAFVFIKKSKTSQLVKSIVLVITLTIVTFLIFTGIYLMFF